jgi:hypothetical protein
MRYARDVWQQYGWCRLSVVNRRTVLKGGVAAAMAARLPAWARRAETAANGPRFTTQNAGWQKAYDRALEILAANVQVLPRVPLPVLIEGAEYAGVWQECGPHEALVYRRFRPDVARNAHMTFFLLQREDGQLPANNKRSEAGFGQIQMVAPIAATAWELAREAADSELLERAYASCSRWDGWLMRYRNTRGTGLIEGFCTYDTGMDNSPRWAGVAPQCPGKDARRCPDSPGLPRLCPDLSATVYGARVALAEMAEALSRRVEAERWRESAASLRESMMEKLYVEEDAAFYDLDAQNKFVKVRTDVLTRVCGEHVVDTRVFAKMWEQQLGSPKAFWPAYPLPSVAMDDPAFVRPIERNSWGGPSQALTALRAGRWMDYYGRSAEFAQMMLAWCEALEKDMSFRQQMDPVTGEFTQGGAVSYSPAALVMYDYTWRLAGVREERGQLEWTVRPGMAASERARFAVRTKGGEAEMRYDERGAKLTLDGREIATVEGIARLVTSGQGRPQKLVGVDAKAQTVTLHLSGEAKREVRLEPNQEMALRG